MSFRSSSATARRLVALAGVTVAAVLALSGAAVRGRVRASGPLVDSCVRVLTDAEVVSLGVPVVSREFRAAWISPVEGGEWPSHPGMSPEEQRAELAGMLDRAVSLGLNAVVLHVRMAADAIYPTNNAPWSSYLTREAGQRGAPGYDPLAYAIGEAHRRGLQLHAWFNPFRAAPPEGNRDVRPGARFVAREHPKWVVHYGTQTWIDPGVPEARRAVLDAIMEVVDKYDVDGVHLDDYFYPYLETRTEKHRVGKGKKRHTVVTHETIEFPDATSWKRYGAGKFDTRADWRRANINDLVSKLYGEVKARKRWVLVGVSPFGIWRPGSPSGISGLDAYSEIYADSRKWLREGWLDYITPQLYWQMNGDEHRFARLDAWWREQNVRGRHVWPGLFTMRVASRGDPWPAVEIPAQILALRDARKGTQESVGHVHFRLGSMTPGSSLAQRLARDAYQAPALPPASPWLGAALPNGPVVEGCSSTPGPVPMRVSKDGNASALAGGAVLARSIRVESTGAMTATPRPGATGPWVRIAPAADGAPARWWLLQLRARDGAWTTMTLAGDQRAVPIALPNGERAAFVSMTAVSPSGVLGLPVVVQVEEP